MKKLKLKRKEEHLKVIIKEMKKIALLARASPQDHNEKILNLMII